MIKRFFKGLLFQWFFRELAITLESFSEAAAPNFIEGVVTTRHGDYLVTVCRPNGKRPTEIIDELKKENASLKTLNIFSTYLTDRYSS